MIRAVLDTNVLVSASLVPEGAPAAVVESALLGRFTLCVSAAILKEYREVLPRPKFIDDTDVIFDGNSDGDFCRYLLTLLDGLESASSERVCVMMTAMNPGSLPAAMLRSGRVELWLETRLPDAVAREQILRDRIAGVEAFAAADMACIAESSKGLTGADLKAVVEDAKLLFAHDVSTATPSRPIEEYFAEAIQSVRANHRKPVGF